MGYAKDMIQIENLCKMWEDNLAAALLTERPKASNKLIMPKRIAEEVRAALGHMAANAPAGTIYPSERYIAAQAAVTTSSDGTI